MNAPVAALIVCLALTGVSCEGRSGGGSDAADRARLGGADPAPDAAAVPVEVAEIRRDTLEVTVSAPGRTAILREETVRAPFAGTLTALSVADGDPVMAGEVIGRLVSRSSEAAREGARAMMESARTHTDSTDAREAMDLARREWVERALAAPEAGVVLSHAASPGDRLSEGDEILRIAAAGSAVFQAEVSQNDLARVRPGQTARIRLAAISDTLAGVVHGVLPAASNASFSAPVRIDFRRGLEVPAVGLFGTATIVVGERAGVLSVPAGAVLTDDVSGVSRIARIVRGNGGGGGNAGSGRGGRILGGIAVWDTVRTGVADHGRIEISGRGLAPGEPVIVAGQVGLPDSTAVRTRP